MIIKNIKVSDIKPYEKNQKKHPAEQVKNIATSIKKYGFIQPVVLDANNEIIIGHGRILAAKQLKLEEVPCVYAENLTEEQIRELRIIDNKLNESEWEWEFLKNDLSDLDFSDFDIDFGLSLDDDEPELIEDSVPEIDESAEPKTKLGDVYKLGNHRLMCGDSTSVTDVEKLMNGEHADLVFTDPPYKVETKGGCTGMTGKALQKQGNDIDFISDFNPAEFLDVMPTVFNKNMNAYVFCNKELLPDYLSWAKQMGYSFNVLIWKKPSAIPIADSHRPDIEYLLLFRKNAIWNNSLDGVNYSRCLEFSRVKRTEENGNHPTIKPVELIANELKISSNHNSNVVDFFGGSGSTLIACEQTGRKCYMMEFSPRYVDVIVERWEKLTGEKAELINE